MQNFARYVIFKIIEGYMSQRHFRIKEIVVNGISIKDVIVDSYVDKHKDITDDLLLDLIRLLNGIYQLPEDTKPPYEYYSSLLTLEGKQYRLVWLLEDSLWIPSQARILTAEAQECTITHL